VNDGIVLLDNASLHLTAIEDAEYKGDMHYYSIMTLFEVDIDVFGEKPYIFHLLGNYICTERQGTRCELDHVINVNLVLMKMNITAKRVITAGSPNFDGTYTYRGYSDRMVCEEHFVLRWPDNLPLDSGASLIAECKDNIS
ncbi:hypothetical protein Tco_1340983, partial [Tanacetum coccineum]